MFDVKFNGNKIEYKSFVFSGGEVSVKLLPNTAITSPFYNDDNITITAHLTDSEKVMELVMLVDALRRNFGTNTRIKLVMPYVPYARQDRVCAPGEALSMKVFAGIINALNFERVTVYDAHSDVSLALIDRVFNVRQEDTLPVRFKDKALLNRCILVSPDAGASKKVFEVAKQLHLTMIQAEKKRDPNTGDITGTVVHSNHVGDVPFLVLDDICDGGKTFVELAKKLSELTTGKLYLYVTHGIFSKGLGVLEDWYDKIYTAYPFPNVDLTNPKLEVI